VRNCPPCLQEDALPKHRPFAGRLPPAATSFIPE
jgi:hypothetical protein